jgi:hypothetical protein
MAMRALPKSMGLFIILSAKGGAMGLVRHTKDSFSRDSVFANFFIGSFFIVPWAQEVRVSIVNKSSKVFIMIYPKVRLNLFYQIFLRVMLK